MSNRDLYVVMGASGHVGGHIARRLLADGKKVRLVARQADALKELVKQGGEVVVASVDDPAALSRAFDGATAAFVMIPPGYTEQDHRGFQRRAVATIAGALRRGGVRYVVSLSSVGAHLPEKTGPIMGLRHMEETLNANEQLHALHLRPTYFMENHFHAIPVIKAMGMIAGAMKADLYFPMIATRDIGDRAAEALAGLAFTGHTTQELLGPREYTMNEVARVLGAAIQKPDLQYMQLPYADVEKAMAGSGMSANAAALMIEMIRGFNDGYIKPQEPRSNRTTTPTTLESFAADFARAYGSH